MQTHGHVLISLGLLGGRDRAEGFGGLLSDRSRWTWPIILGALIPDLMMFWFYFWTKVIKGLPDREIWGELYWLENWQQLFAPFNSIPLALIGLGIAIYWKRGAIAACFASALLHCLADLPLHNDDAHQHFWPFSSYRFQSPVSYWDPEHYAVWGALFEVFCVLGATMLILRWSKSRWGKGLAIALATLYVLFYAAAYSPLGFAS